MLPRPAGMHGMVPKRTPRGVVDESRAARPAPIKTLHASKTSTHTAKIQDLQGRLSLQLAAETFRFHSRLLGSWGLGFGRICTGRNSLIPDGWMDGWMDRQSSWSDQCSPHSCNQIEFISVEIDASATLHAWSIAISSHIAGPGSQCATIMLLSHTAVQWEI